MELTVNVDELRKKKIFLACPMYGGMNHGLFMKSCLDLQTLCTQYGIEIRFSFLFNESLITRARNYLVDEFLRCEGFTHHLFIDADIHFTPHDVLTLLAMDKDVAGGPYPKKSINWNNVKEAVIKHPEIEAGKLEGLVGEYVFNPVAGTQQFSVIEPLEVMEIGTGFMMIKREVFDAFKEAYPCQSYKPDHHGQPNFDGSRYIHAYFDTVIDSNTSWLGRGEPNYKGSDRYLSEDYAFCQAVRNIGKKIYLCPWMKCQHIGTYPFTSDMPAVAEFCGKL